ncbi:Uncharacterised protein [Mycobacteroides abscessus subsp. abscessus]|nr:Uncharacterised protein [Mycobacteroides abscessus subsp. abscessus]
MSVFRSGTSTKEIAAASAPSICMAASSPQRSDALIPRSQSDFTTMTGESPADCSVATPWRSQGWPSVPVTRAFGLPMRDPAPAASRIPHVDMIMLR